MAENKIENKVTNVNSQGIETWAEAVGAEELENETLVLTKTIENLRAKLKFRNLCLAIGCSLLLAAIAGIIVLTILLLNEKTRGPSAETFPDDGEIVFEGIGTLRLTSTILSEQSNIDAQCKAEFGSDAKVADWTYDLSQLSDDQVDAMTDALGIEESFNTDQYFVSNQGDHFYSGGSRAYFFENHGGNPPSNWLVHDQLGRITLGSWYDITGPALCIISTFNTPDPNPTVPHSPFDPPSPAQCAKIAAGKEIEFQAALIMATPPMSFDIEMDVTTNFGTDPSLWVPGFVKKMQQVFAPELAGCNDIAMSTSAVRGGGRRLTEKFIVRNAIFEADHDGGATCLPANDSPRCFRVLAKVTFILGGPENALNLVNRISDLFVEDSLVTKLGLQEGVYSMNTIGITSTDTPFLPPMQPTDPNGEIMFEGIGTLRLTSTILSEQNSFDAQCKLEFGSDAKVADWTYDLSQLSDDQVDAMTDALGIEESFNTDQYFVSNQGDHFYSGGSRAYFFENHGGNPPSNWLVHDQLGRITLGSWYDITGPALCITAPSHIVHSENRYMSNGRIFKLSTTTIKETDDFDATCQSDLGDGYRVADYYHDIKASLQESDTADLVTALSMPKGRDENFYFVNYKGSKFSEDQTDFYVSGFGTPRVWFVENHGDNAPHYDWFDKHGKLELGAWFDRSGRALCVSEKGR